MANEIEYDALSYGLLYFRHRNKNYVCSSALEKGKAIRRFKNRFHPDYIVVAGDSEIDLSMIPEADEAYMSSALFEQEPVDAKTSFINPLLIAETKIKRTPKNLSSLRFILHQILKQALRMKCYQLGTVLIIS